VARISIAWRLLGLLLSVATVWMPWSISRIGAAQFLYSSWPLWRLVPVKSHGPLVWCAHGLDALLFRVLGRGGERADEESIEEEIRTIVTKAIVKVFWRKRPAR